MHGKTAQAQTQQQPRETGIAGHFPTDGDRLAGIDRGLDRHRQQLQHRRVQRIVQMRHGFIGTVDRQRVLDQVIGADRQEIDIFEEHAGGEGRRRHLDHGSEQDLAIDHALVIQLLARRFQHLQGLTDFTLMGQHRDQHMNAPKGRSTQDGAQLGQEHGRLGQAPADGAQAQRRIQVRGIRHAVIQRLVGSHIDGAYRQRQALHAFQRLTVGTILFFFVRMMLLASHEQEFAAEQADPDRA